MATKEQERKALEQIRQIIEGLGKVSYIGMAMEGMLEDAAENIENDFGVSMKGRLDDANKIIAIREEQIDKLSKDLSLARKELELARKTCADESERRKEIWNRLKETEKTAMENLNELAEARAEVKWQEEEIIRLKVKCFDLMEKQS